MISFQLHNAFVFLIIVASIVASQCFKPFYDAYQSKNIIPVKGICVCQTSELPFPFVFNIYTCYTCLQKVKTTLTLSLVSTEVI